MPWCPDIVHQYLQARLRRHQGYVTAWLLPFTAVEYDAVIGGQGRIEPGDLSRIDVEHLALLRANVDSFLSRTLAEYGSRLKHVLDIAPQDHAGARSHLADGVTVDTLDIDPSAGPTYVADLCAGPLGIPEGAFDAIVCTEVLEHTLEPFAAAAEMHRLLRPGGLLLLSCPFNLRIHGPLPDCWRFTEHGLRSVLSAFEILELEALETPGRPLMPIHYTVVARKPLAPTG